MNLNILAIIISYFIGNFSTSLLISKFWAGIDIRKHGSGNAGATNVLRTLGIKAGILTFLGDALKGVIAVWIGRKIGGEDIALLCGIAVVMGHNWPVLFGFKGGKGISTSIGIVFAVYAPIAVICILIGIVMIIRTRYISLGSIIGISLLPLLFLTISFKYFLFGLALAIMALFRHSANIRRLLHGTESKLGEKSGIN